MKMHRSHKHHSLSFTKFVARLQHTFSSKHTKSSTVIIQQQHHSRVCSSILYKMSLIMIIIFRFRHFRIVFNYLKSSTIHHDRLNMLVK